MNRYFLMIIFLGHFLVNLRADVTPNFVLILADDLGYGDLSVTGSKQIRTPSIDSIAQNGVRFTHAYVTSAVCAPSRAGLLTGMHPFSFGFRDNLTPVQPGHDPATVGLPTRLKTIANLIQPAGYTSAIIGKWHLGALPHFHPLKRGFHEFWGYLGGGHDYFTASEMNNGMKGRIESNFKTPAPLTYLTDDQGDECVAMIRRHKHRPFFLFASFSAPHSPMQARKDDLEKLAQIPNQLRRTYCAMVHRLDENVGKILKELRDQGLEQNTIVVFLSDNGGPCAPGNANGSINAPLNGGKTTVFEGGIRVPLLIQYPAKIPKGIIRHQMVSSMDIAPTFFAASGLTPEKKNPFHGHNLLPLMASESTPNHHQTLVWNYTVGSAIRDGEWKLLQLPDQMPRLYHLVDDPSELHDLATVNPHVTASLLRKLGDWHMKSPNPLFREPADWRLRHRKFYDAAYQLQQPEP